MDDGKGKGWMVSDDEEESEWSVEENASGPLVGLLARQSGLPWLTPGNF